jgi:ABC-type Zn uptake system ZnuABC Zn-binding protein ZnuA
MILTRSQYTRNLLVLSLVAIAGLLLTACGREGTPDIQATEGKIRVVATTTFIGDVVGNIAGDAVELTVLMVPGQNPHSYHPAPMDLVAVTQADLILVNGFGLEEFLDDLLAGSDTSAKVIAVSEGIDPVFADHLDHDHEDEDHQDGDHDDGHDNDGHDGEDHDDDHKNGDHLEETMGVDPHVWFDPENIKFWVDNITAALIQMDPGMADQYQAKADSYLSALSELDKWIENELNQIPSVNRKLVSDHISLGYFARAYGFEEIGAVIPASTTEAETSGLHLADLIDSIPEHQVKAIFIGRDFDPSLAEQVADEAGIELVKLYFGSLTDGPPAGTYLEFMRQNVSLIATALKE